MSVPESVTLYLYAVNEEPAVIGKTLGSPETCKGTFRGEVNVISPVLTLERKSSPSICEINKFNYLQISDLNRYYFIQNITISPKGLITLSLLEDVLETYKTSIRNMNCFVERCENSTYIDSKIPDQMAIPHPRIVTNKTNFTVTASSIREWLSNEDVWNLDEDDNSKLCYIITFSNATFKRRISSQTTENVAWYGPCPKLLCTRAFLRQFYIGINDLAATVFEKWTHFSDAIVSIETIPEAFILPTASSTTTVKKAFHGWSNNDYVKYRFAADGSATGAGATDPGNSQVVNWIKIGHEAFDFTNGSQWDGKEGYTPIYAFALDRTDEVIETTFTTVRSVEDRWESSQQYKKYSIKFNPFGEIELPADELLSATRIYLKVKHSLISGQAQLLYYTDVIGIERPIAETMLNFQQPYKFSGDLGNLVTSMVKTVATVAIGTKIANAATTTTTTIPQTHSVSVNTPVGAEVGFVEGSLGQPDAGLSFPYKVNDVPYKNMPKKETHTLTMGRETTTTSTQTASSTAQTLQFGNVMSGVGNCLDSIPVPEYKGTLRAVLIDTTPIFMVHSREYLQPNIHHSGRPCFQNVLLSNLAVSTNDGGYFKVGTYTFRNFRQSPDPIPLYAELEMVGKELTTGCIMAVGSG